MQTEQEYLQFIKNIEEKAFKRGYDTAVQKILRAVNGGDSTPISRPVQDQSVLVWGKNPFRPGTDSARVYDFIENNPGLRGTEIIEQSGIVGKTVRTALHRMKTIKGGVATVLEGKWYIK